MMTNANGTVADFVFSYPSSSADMPRADVQQFFVTNLLAHLVSVAACETAPHPTFTAAFDSSHCRK